MKRHARPLILLLAAVALGASLASLYVHYRLISDPTYSSFCDVSATVSCQQVFQSQYGSVFGVPVAAGGAIWSGLVLILALGMAPRGSELAARVAAYIFVLATIGLAAVFYYGYTSFIVLGLLCPLCTTMYVAVVGLFIVSAGSAGPLSSLAGRLGSDLGALKRSAVGSALAAVWVVASLGLLLWFPREPVVTAEEATGGPAASVPLEMLSPEQVAEWEQYLASQPRLPEAMPTGDTKVLVMKFNDYQCPACRQTWLLYRDIFAKYEAQYPGVFKFETRDFPLEAECGMGGVHGAACEAAAAVRLARERGRDRQLEAVLFERQSASMTRDQIVAALGEVTDISRADFDARYAGLIEEIRSDALLGQRLGVSGTPTFFLNGIRMPSIRPSYFDAAIAYELRRAGVAP